MLIRYSPRAIRWLKDCPLHIQERILEKINFFSSQDNPHLYAVKISGTPLVDSESEIIERFAKLATVILTYRP